MNSFRSWFAALLAGVILLLSACSPTAPDHDATGTFEADETIIAAEATGRLVRFDVDEGQRLDAGTAVGTIDSVQLWLRRRQIDAQIDAILSRRPNIASQVAALQEQLSGAQREQRRLTAMAQSDAATQRQVDEATTQVGVLQRQIDALYSSLRTTSASLVEETAPLRIQQAQLDDQLQKCRIVNPLSGIVLASYARVHEVTAPGKALYRIADLSYLYLRAYVTGDQLATVRLGQTVRVFTDDGHGGSKDHAGTVSWISDKAEFTPKTIQTKNERANLVYAVKIRVRNPGVLKIGMYGEVDF